MPTTSTNRDKDLAAAPVPVSATTKPGRRPKRTLLRCLTCAPRVISFPRLRRRRHRQADFRSVRAVFWPLVSTRLSSSASTSADADTAAAAALPDSATAAAAYRGPLPSPVTPAYVPVALIRRPRVAAGDGGGEGAEEEAEAEACRLFERCLLEMLAEEGKVRDLADVEELTRWWGSLTSPVFVDMVCRFYGELCKDLFPDPTGACSNSEGDHGNMNCDVVDAQVNYQIG